MTSSVPDGLTPEQYAEVGIAGVEYFLTLKGIARDSVDNLRESLDHDLYTKVENVPYVSVAAIGAVGMALQQVLALDLPSDYTEEATVRTLFILNLLVNEAVGEEV